MKYKKTKVSVLILSLILLSSSTMFYVYKHFRTEGDDKVISENRVKKRSVINYYLQLKKEKIPDRMTKALTLINFSHYKNNLFFTLDLDDSIKSEGYYPEYSRELILDDLIIDQFCKEKTMVDILAMGLNVEIRVIKNTSSEEYSYNLLKEC